MARRRFFVESVRQGHAVLEGTQARHLRQVLRAEIGQRYELSDNATLYLAEVEAFGQGQVRFRVLEKLAPEEPSLRLTLLPALIKFDRFEWMLEKATELGVERIAPIQARRSEKGLDRAADKRGERWRRLLRESSQQARRPRLPELLPVMDLGQALALSGDYRYLLDEQHGAAPLLSAVPEPGRRRPSDAVLLLVGPEGGWTDEERSRASEAGWTPVSLGLRVLRAETAAAAGLAVLAAAWDAGPKPPSGAVLR